MRNLWSGEFINSAKQRGNKWDLVGEMCKSFEPITGAKQNREDEKNMVGLAHSRASR